MANKKQAQPKTNAKSVQHCIFLDPALSSQLRKQAKEEKRHISTVVAMALEKHLTVAAD